MPVDASLIGRTFAPTAAYDVTHERVANFAAAIQTPWSSGDPAPVTFPIVVAFTAMTALMNDETVGIALHRVVHGEQKFTYVRPVRVGDQLVATLSVDSLRQISGMDIIGTTSRITDPAGVLVCTAGATLIHRGGA